MADGSPPNEYDRALAASAERILAAWKPITDALIEAAARAAAMLASEVAHMLRQAEAERVERSHDD